MNIEIYEKGFRDSRFYSLIGPLALNRSMIEEMHDKQYGPIYDEPYAIWFIAYNSTEEDLLGFCALFDKEKEIFFDNTYVLKQYRGHGIGKKLFKARLVRAKFIQGDRKIKGITKNEIQKDIYLKNGFRQASKRGKYYWMELMPNGGGK